MSNRKRTGPKTNIKICIISTTGGHLNQVLQLREVYERYNHYFITARSEYATHTFKNEKIFYVRKTLRKTWNFLINFFESLKIIISERPDFIITTGSGDAIAMCYLGKLMRAKIIFIETYARVQEPSLFGLMVNPISNLTIVQWEPLLKAYKGSRYGGPLFKIQSSQDILREAPQKIFITVGTHPLSFDRLLKAVDELVEKGIIRGNLVAQIGHSSYEPKNYKWFRFVDYEQFIGHVKDSNLIITHDGATAMATALHEGKTTIVIPRLKEYGEASYDNKYELARALEKEKLIILVRDVKELEKALIMSKGFRFTAANKESNVIGLVEEYIERSE